MSERDDRIECPVCGGEGYYDCHSGTDYQFGSWLECDACEGKGYILDAEDELTATPTPQSDDQAN